MSGDLGRPTFASDEPPAASAIRRLRCGACSTYHPVEAITQLRCGLYRCLPCFEDLRGVCQWPDRLVGWRPVGAITMQPSIPSTINVPMAQPFARSLRLRERAGRPLPPDGKARALTED
jgi:hypothetical protein